ncbi:alpha/beta hydrolase [Frankia sp. CcI49]|uniref:alpha/beta hydrolase n=1 Tax=Frankia sp. CcI49 TaxID=1745382 RepID=UPI000977CD16|nr:alpha/beta hydrolase [Frankia sp. CcI49]ONH54098.1 alpha/beta hydrolase [Frankia sp. CcI49]
MTDHLDVLDFEATGGLRTRGTVLIVPGRGESPAVYRRFGARVASDTYRVRATEAPVLDPADPIASLEVIAKQLAEAAAGVGDEPTRPLVAVGSDTGAVALAALAALAAGGQRGVSDVWRPDALVLAGLPGYGAHATGGWDDELNARTHCPVHRGVLSDDPAVQRGSLGDVVPDALLDLAYGSTATLPQLLLVGDDDPVADREALSRAAKALPNARLTVVRGAHHDVLNDVHHRSVSAEVVTFLEALRNEPALSPIIVTEASRW